MINALLLLLAVVLVPAAFLAFIRFGIWLEQGLGHLKSCKCDLCVPLYDPAALEEEIRKCVELYK